MRTASMVLGAAAVTCLLAACGAGSSRPDHVPAPSHRFEVKRVRVATTKECALALTRAHAEVPENWNLVPGPDSSWLVVRKDSSKRTRIYLLRRGSDEIPLFGAGGTSPAWSPNGRYAAAILWRSSDRPWSLEVQDLITMKTWEARIPANITEFQWSPDSHYILGRGYLIATKQPALALVRGIDGQGTIIDTLRAGGSYQFSWAPDSRYAIVSVPTRLSGSEDICGADLWVMSREGDVKYLLLKTPGLVEARPHWIDRTRIAVDVYRCTDDEAGPDTTRIVELRMPE
jgi:hypothetical protein